MPLPVRRALLSVSDKTGLVELARALAKRRRRAAVHRRHRAPARRARASRCARSRSYTGFPEIMDGRVKTLHPKIHGGLLGRRGTDEAVMAEHGIAPIDLLVVNLYPFAATVARPDCSYAEAIENIDIGGPAMLRAAAKNHEAVLGGRRSGRLRRRAGRARRARRRQRRSPRARGSPPRPSRTPRATTRMVAGYLHARAAPATASRFPATLPLVFEKVQDLRYGENPHQQAAFYREPGARAAPASPARACCRARICRSTTSPTPTRRSSACGSSREPACVIVKHANPCGVARRRHRCCEAYEARLPHRPDLGLRRHHRLQPRARCRDRARRSSIGSSWRCSPPRPCMPQARAGARRASRTCACWSWATSAPRAGAALELRSVTGGLLVQTRDTGRPRPRATLHDRHAPPARPRRSSPTCASPGACASS